MKILEINDLINGIFIERTNRYLSKIKFNNEIFDVHVHDPGRLKELLYPGNKVLIKKANNINRKTKYDLIAAKKNNEFVLVNSMYHRYIAENFLRNKFSDLKAEVKYNNSRIDFLANGKIWIEIKGCTLSENGIAKFPDAPTKRGVKHLNELIELSEKGFEAQIYFLIFSASKYFSPNLDTDPEFSKFFYLAIEKGVKVFPLLFSFENGKILFKREIKII
ncbi:DNA/RNA nuclease SfsA [Marinitoga sp. 38H-ov]|uniref:DNA/RNA nuclease SfsA n=1 Tax=Marinitoga sp. 38H-ov TaxID=1755814 RepID=UPI0013EA0CAB|nr:DNA/RNA nuclease SfsA [Marinitoga sp. 38H-ov]KAF2955338.1 sugar fermentation stimulation protein [Marinitoga sp. 38H-ov]